MPSLDGPSRGLEAFSDDQVSIRKEHQIAFMQRVRGRKHKAARIDRRWNGCTADNRTPAIILPPRIEPEIDAQRDTAARAQHGERADEHEATECSYVPTCTHRWRLHLTNRRAGNDANHSPAGMSDKTPTPCHLFRRHEAMLPFADRKSTRLNSSHGSISY